MFSQLLNPFLTSPIIIHDVYLPVPSKVTERSILLGSIDYRSDIVECRRLSDWRRRLLLPPSLPPPTDSNTDSDEARVICSYTASEWLTTGLGETVVHSSHKQLVAVIAADVTSDWLYNRDCCCWYVRPALYKCLMRLCPTWPNDYAVCKHATATRSGISSLSLTL